MPRQKPIVLDSGQFENLQEAADLLHVNQLDYDIAENSFLELTRGAGNRVTDIIIWTDSGKTIKIREINITRSAGRVSTIVSKQYSDIGSLLSTYTETFNRTLGLLDSVDGVLT